jgi:hypothetical protein
MQQWQTGSSKHGSFHEHMEHKERRKVITKEMPSMFLAVRADQEMALSIPTLCPL